MSSHGLLNDILFKLVFGSANSEPILIALLNALLGYTGEQKITSLTIENPTLEKEYISDKGALLDLKAQDRAGRWYNIEVQLQSVHGRESYFKRSLFYWSKLYSSQIERGHQYSKLQKTISISLLDFLIFPDDKTLHHTYVLKERSTSSPFLDMLELHYIELGKFSLHKAHSLRTPFEKWLYILKFSELYSEPGTALPENLQEEAGIIMAIETMRKAYARDEVRELIKMREKAKLDYQSGLADAHEQGLEQGLEKGLEQGLEKGLEQGLEQGLKQGRDDVARKMLELGVSFEVIQQATGLSESAIKALESA